VASRAPDHDAHPTSVITKRNMAHNTKPNAKHGHRSWPPVPSTVGDATNRSSQTPTSTSATVMANRPCLSTLAATERHTDHHRVSRQRRSIGGFIYLHHVIKNTTTFGVDRNESDPVFS
jgi:hypothetical protein